MYGGLGAFEGTLLSLRDVCVPSSMPWLNRNDIWQRTRSTWQLCVFANGLKAKKWMRIREATLFTPQRYACFSVQLGIHSVNTYISLQVPAMRNSFVNEGRGYLATLRRKAGQLRYLMNLSHVRRNQSSNAMTDVASTTLCPVCQDEIGRNIVMVRHLSIFIMRMPCRAFSLLSFSSLFAMCRSYHR